MKSEQGLTAKVSMISQQHGGNPEISCIHEKVSLLDGTEIDDSMENDDIFVKNTHKRKKRKRCYICGDVSHDGSICHEVTNCLICLKKGHLIMDCPNENDPVDFASRLCLKCGNTGHDMFSCTNNYDSEDLKAIECYICRKSGHLCCVYDKSEGPIQPSCYNCGQLGHFGLVSDAFQFSYSSARCDFCNSTFVLTCRSAFCEKCKATGHYSQQCSQKVQPKTAAEKRRARRARRSMKKKQIPILNTYRNQPDVWFPPPLVGPHYRQPVTIMGPLPSHEHHITYQLGTRVLDSQYSDHQYSTLRNRPQITQIPLGQGRIIFPPQPQAPHVNAQTMLPQTLSRVPLTYDITVLPFRFPGVAQNYPRLRPSHQPPLIVPLTGNYIPQPALFRESRVMPHHVQTFERPT